MFAQRCAENLAYLAFDISRGVFEYVAESLAFAVEVGNEMLGALGEVEYGLKIYYLGAGRTDGAEVLRQQFEHTRVCLDF